MKVREAMTGNVCLCDPDLSIREVARRVGVSPETIMRLERGGERTLTIDLIARLAPVVGLELAAQLHANGDPVRDRAHLALLERLRTRLPSGARWRAEVPVPIAGDLRSGDAVIAVAGGDVLVEAETHLADIQAIERKIAAKPAFSRERASARLSTSVEASTRLARVVANSQSARIRWASVP